MTTFDDGQNRSATAKHTPSVDVYYSNPWVNESVTDLVEARLEAALSASERERSASAETGFVARRRYGYGLVVVTVMASAAVVLAAATIGETVFAAQERTLRARLEPAATAEARIIEELRRESAEELSRKDEEIERYLDRIRTLDRRQAEVERSMSAALAERRREMEAEMARRLADAEEALIGRGLAAESVQSTLLDLQAELQQRNATELLEFAAQRNVAAQQERERLVAEREQADRGLAEATRERETIILTVRSQLTDTPAAATVGSASEGSASGASASAGPATPVTNELRRLREQSNIEQLARSQLQSKLNEVVRYASRVATDNRALPQLLTRTEELEALLAADALPASLVEERRFAADLLVTVRSLVNAVHATEAVSVVALSAARNVEVEAERAAATARLMAFEAELATARLELRRAQRDRAETLETLSSFVASVASVPSVQRAGESSQESADVDTMMAAADDPAVAALFEEILELREASVVGEEPSVVAAEAPRFGTRAPDTLAERESTEARSAEDDPEVSAGPRIALGMVVTRDNAMLTVERVPAVPVETGQNITVVRPQAGSEGTDVASAIVRRVTADYLFAEIVELHRDPRPLDVVYRIGTYRIGR